MHRSRTGPTCGRRWLRRYLPGIDASEPDLVLFAPVPPGVVLAVHRSAVHEVAKDAHAEITLVVDHGVDGDAHAGATVQHRSRVRRGEVGPNLRQVHLLHRELHDELRLDGFDVAPGRMGENVTTSGVSLLDLPVGALLHLGATAVVEVAGLRNPCWQLDTIQPGLMAACLGKDERGLVVRKAGVMGVVRSGGAVRSGDVIEVEHPAGRLRRLKPV